MSPQVASRAHKILSTHHFWVLLLMFSVCVIFHYPQQILQTDSISLFSFLGLTRHSVERIFLLVPVAYTGLIFGFKAGMVSLVVASAIMLPRVLFISSYMPDALLETGIIIVTSVLVNLWFRGQRVEKERRREVISRLESVEQELLSSEQKYQYLFDNASDAMWVHDLEGNFQYGNNAFQKLSGYTLEEWVNLNITDFLTSESLAFAREIRRKLLAGEQLEQPYEQQFFRKDGAKRVVKMATSPIISDGKVSGFEHVARDVTEEKQLQENMRFYIQQVTRAQEDERKRIARELHDDVSQALLLLMQRLDLLMSSTKPKLSYKLRENLESLRGQAIEVLESLRRCAQDLRPRILDDLGLLAALEWITEDMATNFGMDASVEVVGMEQALPAETQLLLFRIGQEALSNVRRHAGASKAVVRLESDSTKIKMTVCDDGRGFEVPERMGDLAGIGKLGLAGMQERARLLGGSLKVESSPGKGTKVIVELPS
jgi:two-component system sensor histidine kinase DegS